MLESMEHGEGDKDGEENEKLGVVGHVAHLRENEAQIAREGAKRSWNKVRMALVKARVVSKMNSPRFASKTGTTSQDSSTTSERLPLTRSRTDTEKEKHRMNLKFCLEAAMRQVATENADADKRTLAQQAEMKKKAAAKARLVALEMFLGLLIDGVPEGILMGIMAAEGHLTPVLIISLLIANFPEAFASSSLFLAAEMSLTTIMGMWTGLCLLVGCLCGVSCWLLLFLFPDFSHGETLPHHWLLATASVEGITGGAMIACVSAVMLPEAFERAGKHGSLVLSSGFMCVCGFLLSVGLKANLG
jgi:hypothetical protein